MSRLKTKERRSSARHACILQLPAWRGEVWGNECTTKKKKEPLLLLMAMAISRMVPLIENLDTLQVQMNERVKREAGGRASDSQEREKRWMAPQERED